MFDQTSFPEYFSKSLFLQGWALACPGLKRLRDLHLPSLLGKRTYGLIETMFPKYLLSGEAEDWIHYPLRRALTTEFELQIVHLHPETCQGV